MIENEFKFIVDKKIFYNLFEYAKAEYPNCSMKRIEQRNYYYDTQSLSLHNSNVTLRVREINGQFVIEKKESEPFTGNCRKAVESQITIDLLPDNICGKKVGCDSDSIFEMIGFLDTDRTRFTLENGIKIDFDISTYFLNTDYELEIEFETAIPSAFIDRIPSKFKESKPESKYSRFINEYLKQI